MQSGNCCIHHGCAHISLTNLPTTSKRGNRIPSNGNFGRIDLPFAPGFLVIYSMKSSSTLKNGLWSALLFFVCLSATSCNKDKSIDPEDAADFEAYLADEMDAQHISAASVVLFRGNSVLYEKYEGLADRENGTALNADQVFLLASVSKTITAVALMQLFDQGRFTLETPINDHLDFDVIHPDFSTPITFRHLLTHTSGIIDGPSTDDQYYYGQDSPVPLATYMRDYLTPSGQFYDAQQNFDSFEPGEGYEYSNIGAALMGVLVEQISGIGFNDYCKQNIFQPLGMTRTFWRLSEIDTTTIVRPYTYDRREFQPLQHYTFTDYPNGGLRSNGLDMMKFCAAIANGGEFNGTRILQASTVAEMLKLQISDLDETQGLSFYIQHASENLWGHEGGESGVSTVVAFNPDNQTGAIVLTNADDADLLGVVVSAYRLAMKL